VRASLSVSLRCTRGFDFGLGLHLTLALAATKGKVNSVTIRHLRALSLPGAPVFLLVHGPGIDRMTAYKLFDGLPGDSRHLVG
jgi:hypothetical protein